jgi:DtxR family transcriptional regulator, Mn-dependent transcriptional regulator
MKSFVEENYLKAIYQLTDSDASKIVSATDLAIWLGLKPPTVLEKLAALSIKKMVLYDKYKGARLTKKGFEMAVAIVRRHRIWETYLYRELQFSWSEVHEIAEQLEHVHSEKLMDKIYQILGQPEFDPHGDPIPSKSGVLPKSNRRPLSKSVKGCNCLILGVIDHSEVFLNYLSELNLALNDRLQVLQILAYDETLQLVNRQKQVIMMSAKAANNILVACHKPNCGCKKQ